MEGSFLVHSKASTYPREKLRENHCFDKDRRLVAWKNVWRVIRLRGFSLNLVLFFYFLGFCNSKYSNGFHHTPVHHRLNGWSITISNISLDASWIRITHSVCLSYLKIRKDQLQATKHLSRMCIDCKGVLTRGPAYYIRSLSALYLLLIILLTRGCCWVRSVSVSYLETDRKQRRPLEATEDVGIIGFRLLASDWLIIQETTSCTAIEKKMPAPRSAEALLCMRSL